MRILSVTQSYAPFYEFGGPPAKVAALATGLAAHGHEVTVLTADWGLQQRTAHDEVAVTAQRSPFGWTREVARVETVYLPTWVHYRATSWNPAVRHFCDLRLKDFDIVHIFGLYDLLGPAVARACRLQGIPYVVEPIGMFVPIVRNIFMKRMYHAVLGRKLVGGAAGVIATAEQEVEELVGGGIPREQIILRRNGVLVPRELPSRGMFRSKHKIPDDAWLILFLGRLCEKKSPELLLEAFAQLPAKIVDRAAWLAFAGPDEAGMQKRLTAQAKVRGVENRVIFSGRVFGNEKWRAYRDADVFVLPSQNENFGNTALEAAACGTPVVITETCGVAPLLAGVAGLAVPHETRAVERAVKQVLSDAELRSTLAAGGKTAAARLGWAEPVDAMEKLYEKLAAQHPLVGQSAGRA